MSKEEHLHRAGLVGIAAVMLLLSAAVDFGQTRGQSSDASPKSEREKMDAKVFGQLAKAWTSFYDGKHADAVKQAEPLLKLNDSRYRWVAIEAAHLQARAYWGHGGRRGQAKARQLWKQLEKLSTLNSLLTRLKIAQALELEAAADDAKRNQAIALLEQILKDRQMNLATPEAGIDLVRLYVQARRFDDAEKTLKFVIAFLGDKRTLIRMELPDEAMVQPHVKAAKAALARLKYERDAGREEFEAAEKLRKQEKWLQAARAYQSITKDFAETDYAPRSELHIGDCLLGLGRESQAVAHWKKFIEPLPAGPWRAHAYIKIIDYCLEQQLDLPEAGKYAALARSSLPTALADEKAGESWRAAAFDVQLRVGLVSFCEGKAAVAAEAFEAAKQLANKKTAAERLYALITAAKSGKGVIPEDCRASGSRGHGVAAGDAGPSDKAALALSMGVIHMVAGRLDNADAFFDRVLGDPTSKDVRSRRPMPGATRAQMAFATFGRGAVLHAHRKEPEAREQFLASLKAFGDGCWHDETLYRVATITQDLASAKFAKAPEPATPSAKPLTTKQREAAAKAEKERLAAFLKAEGEALPYWQELITRYPKSPRVEQAMYNAGVLLCELAEAAPAAQAEKSWKDAAFMLNRFCEFYPKSPLAGDAILRQTDIAMERLFDLALARTNSEQGVNWAKDASDNATEVARELPPWAIGVAQPQPPCVEEVLYNSYLRAGLVAYLAQKYDDAASMFKAADGVGCPRPYRVVQGSLPTGMERLIASAQKGEALTPPEVLKGDPKPAMILGLGDLYFAAEQWDKSRELYRLVYDHQVRPIKPLQISWAAFMIARTHFWKFEFAEAQQFYHVVFDKYPQSPWAATALFYNATMAYSNLRDMKEAAACLDQIRKSYPKDEMAERAAYLIGQLYQWRREFEKAKAAYAAYLKHYPNGMYAKGIKETLLPEVEKGRSGLEKTTRR